MAFQDPPLQITPETKIGDVLHRYGDIAEVMESFGVKRVGRLSIRRLVAKVLTVRMAAKVHGLSTEEMVQTLQNAILQVHAGQEPSGSRLNNDANGI